MTQRPVTSPRKPPPYFCGVQRQAHARWDQLEADPELAGPWHQLFKQVQSPRHVLSELLQNADDAGATTASVRLVGNEFIFEHNGADFGEAQFASLCKFGFSNKRNLHTIGFRGIGFKSTFSLGNEVRVVTPTLSILFRCRRFTEPVWVPDSPRTDATQIRAFVESRSCLTELEASFREWALSPLSLLFFNSIRSLAINRFNISRVSRGPGPAPNSEWVALSDKPDSPMLLVRSDAALFPDEAIHEIRNERMGASDLDLPPCTLDLVVGSNVDGRFFVVLPTGISTHLPFAINAPFVQDPARLKIKDPSISPTNKWLLQRAGKTAADAMKAWLVRADIQTRDRALAYSMFPDIDREDTSLEGTCGTEVEEAFERAIAGCKFLLAEDGQLTASQTCVAVPPELHEVWNGEQLRRSFGKGHKKVLSGHVKTAHQDRLRSWNAIETVDRDQVLWCLEYERPPRPASWPQLLRLWKFIFEKHHLAPYFQRALRIHPIRGDADLYASDEVVRLEAQRFKSPQAWEFLSKHLRIVDAEWLRYLKDLLPAGPTVRTNPPLSPECLAADVLKALGLDEASDASRLVNQAAESFFSAETFSVDECVQIAHIAAALNASVSDIFHYMTDGGVTPVTSSVVADPDNDLDLFTDEEWCREHLLDRAYWDATSFCDRSVFRQWALSERSRLLTFVPLVTSTRSLWGREAARTLLAERGAKGQPYFHYKTHNFALEDCDFEASHWKHWHNLSHKDRGVWNKVLRRTMDQPGRPWAKYLSARLYQVATTGNTHAATSEPLIPSWLLKLRELPCLLDTHGQVREPAELLRRTAETEALLDTEPFVAAELDTESNRPLLIRLGVRDTPTGPERLLDRLRALSRASQVPVHEVEKWCARLDRLLAKADAAQAEAIRIAFCDEDLILTSDLDWVSSTDVFLRADEDDVPGALTIHPAISHLPIWVRVGVEDRPTIGMALEWLASLEPGPLSPEEARRVRGLLPRHAEHIWKSCACWLNLEGEWAQIEDLKYRLTMQELVPWSKLFASIKRKTADFTRIPAEVCGRMPFSDLRSLASSIEDRMEETARSLEKPSRKAWIATLGRLLSRVRIEGEEALEAHRSAAARLMRTQWQTTSGLRVVPYMDEVPVGLAREADAVWLDELLYVTSRGLARAFKTIAVELAKPFDRSDIADAIKACVERSSEFITEYFEQNFTLLPEGEAEPCRSSKDSAGVSPGEDRNDTSSLPQVTRSTEVETQKIEIEHQDGIHGKQDESSANLAQARRPAKRVEPSFAETFLTSLGYHRNGQDQRYNHPDGSWFQLESGATFPWQRYDTGGQLIQMYWIKEHCLEEEPLKVGADVWQLCQEQPASHTLVLQGTDQDPVEYSGNKLAALMRKGALKLYPADIRLVLNSPQRG